LIYLDWNATTPPHPDVIEAMTRAAGEAWGNPASVHTHGRHARSHVESAREALASLARCDPRDITFTSGGTEANNLALRSAFPVAADDPPYLVTSALEHPSVTRVAHALEREGRARVHWVRATERGIDMSDLESALSARRVRLVTVQAVNHETGLLSSTHAVAALAREHGSLLHIDAVQAWGKVDVDESAGDTRAFAAHKLRGPKGIGALLARPGTSLAPLVLGGAQERGARPGTVDPVACAGLAVAAKRAALGPRRYVALEPLRDELEARVCALREGAAVNGAGPRATHVTSLHVPGFPGPELVAALDLEGVSVSSGSACSAGTSEPSPVISAMYDEKRARESVRVSLGETTTHEDIERAVQAFEKVLRR
jgi:cysteine desulfurase